jgi:hypothetical protein
MYVVTHPYARDAPGNVVEGHLDLAPGDGSVVLVGQPRPGHGRQRVGKLAHDKPVGQLPLVLPPWQVVGRVDGTFQNGIFQNRLFGPTGIFQNGIFQKESFRKYFQQNRNVSEWNHSERIFQKIILAKTESFRMESFRVESFRKYFQ